MTCDGTPSAHAHASAQIRSSRRSRVTIIGGFDVHRAKITFDYLDTETGEVTRGEIRPATRGVLRGWFGRFAGHADVAFAVEGCTGWRFVVEEMVAAGVAPHLAEPADHGDPARPQEAREDRPG